MSKMQCVNGTASQTTWTDQLDGPAGRTSWTDQLDRPAGRTSWTDQLDRPAGRTSSFYLKPWPVCIFEDFPFSLYIVAASESDEGLVFSVIYFSLIWRKLTGASENLEVGWNRIPGIDMARDTKTIQMINPMKLNLNNLTLGRQEV